MNKDELINIKPSESDDFEDKEIIYNELYICFLLRCKEKKETLESFNFARNAGKEIGDLADRILNFSFRIEKFNTFHIHNPDRIINAPDEADRLGEYWICVKYVKPYLMGKIFPRADLVQTEENLFPRLYVNSMACQDGKGTDEAIRRLNYALSQTHSKYGDDFYVVQLDIKKFYDNMNHDAVKKLFEGLPKCAYKTICNIIDSYHSTSDMPECYAYDTDPTGVYGMPKGTLISQWAAVLMLDPVVRLLAEDSNCLFAMSYMDDILALFPDKYSARSAFNAAQKYLSDHALGIKFNERKSQCYKITRGINFCGFRYMLMEDHSVIMRELTNKKKGMYGNFKSIQYNYKYGYIDGERAAAKIRGMFAHLERGDTYRLRKYCQERFYLSHNKD